MINPKVLIIEDDQIQAEDLKARIEKMGSPADVISTEAEFRRKFRDGDLKNYSLAVVDMMLRWTDPAPDMEPPDADVIEEGSYTAGLRCCRSLAARGVPSVVFTALSPNTIPRKPGDHFEIIHKSGDGFARLMDRIRPPR